MRIESIKWLSKSADEAEVVVSDGSFKCEAYSQPCDASVGDVVVQPLHVFGVRSAILNKAGVLGFRKVDTTSLAQHVVAKVIDVREGHLSVGAIELIADDPLPGGMQDGDLIELECARIDMW